jgi:hypothetical protein
VDDRLASALSFVVIGLMGVRLVGAVRFSRTAASRGLIAEIVRGIRWRHIWPVPVVLALVIAVATPLLQVPGLEWGWWSALGGDGNPVFGSSTATTGTALEWLIPLVFIALLVPALPLFAHAEERMFRAGAESWTAKRRVVKVLQFGMVHALIGIPIGAALALSTGGAYFMLVYLREFRATHDRRAATLESTRAHTAYNAVIIAVVLAAIVAQVFT